MSLFDRRLQASIGASGSVKARLLAAVPVVAVLGGSISAEDPVAGVNGSRSDAGRDRLARRRRAAANW